HRAVRVPDYRIADVAHLSAVVVFAQVAIDRTDARPAPAAVCGAGSAVAVFACARPVPGYRIADVAHLSAVACARVAASRTLARFSAVRVAVVSAPVASDQTLARPASAAVCSAGCPIVAFARAGDR